MKGYCRKGGLFYLFMINPNTYLLLLCHSHRYTLSKAAEENKLTEESDKTTEQETAEKPQTNVEVKTS